MRHPTAKLDRIAVQLSGLCLVHCLVLPIAIAVLPALGLAERWHEDFHIVMLFLVLPIAVVALGRGFIRHRQTRVIVLGVLGSALLAIAALVLHEMPRIGAGVSGESADRWATVTGVILLAGSHLINARALQRMHRHNGCGHRGCSTRTAGSIEPQ